MNRLVLAAVATAAVTVVGAQPSYAESVTVRDARGDMWKIEEGSHEPDRAPGARLGDLVRTTARHGTTALVVRARFAELQRTGRRLTLWVELRDDTGRRTHLGVRATRRDRSGETILMTGRGRDIACDVDHRIDYRGDRIRVRVPRQCLGDPRTVRLRVASEQVRRSWAYAWLDNGLGDSMEDRSWTEALRTEAES